MAIPYPSCYHFVYAIREHSIKTGHVRVIVCDMPRSMLVRYICEGCDSIWSARLIDIKRIGSGNKLAVLFQDRPSFSTTLMSGALDLELMRWDFAGEELVEGVAEPEPQEEKVSRYDREIGVG